MTPYLNSTRKLWESLWNTSHCFAACFSRSPQVKAIASSMWHPYGADDEDLIRKGPILRQAFLKRDSTSFRQRPESRFSMPRSALELWIPALSGLTITPMGWLIGFSLSQQQ